MSDEQSKTKPILAYFSHSYRPEQKHTNLRVWEMLSRLGMKFVVDPKVDGPRPMEIAEIEFMMRRCACFVAVVPHRPSLEGQCSPYQIFEHRLAIRAHKPRLVFAESGPSEETFSTRLSTVIPFNDTVEWFDENEERLQTRLEGLAAEARATAPPEEGLLGGVGLILGEDGFYRGLQPEIAAVTQGHNFGDPKPIDLTLYRNVSRLLNELEQYSVVITDVRPPYVPLDLLAAVNGQAIPTLRLCHLRGNEKPETLEKAMGLRRGAKPVGVAAARARRVPLIFAGYKLDDQMQPVLFWRDAEELDELLGERLDRLKEKVNPKGFHNIDTDLKAKQYFLQLGRVPGNVFISNPSELNPFVERLTSQLDDRGIGYFHYRVTGHLKSGSANYEADLKDAIKRSALFVALIDEHYAGSDPCKDELEFAREQYRQGRLLLRPYLLQTGVAPPVDLGLMQQTSLYGRAESNQLDTIVRDAVDGLEIENRIQLGHDERDALDRGLAKIAADPKIVSKHLEDAGFAEDLVDDLDWSNPETSREALLGAARRSLAEANALGRLAYRLTTQVEEVKDRENLARIVSRHRLLPDLRASVRRPSCETGIGYQNGGWLAFGRLEGGVTKETERLENQEVLEKDYVADLVNAAGESQDWEGELVRFGRDLGRMGAFTVLRRKIDGLIQEKGLGERDISICFAGDRTLAAPFEWAIEEDQNSSLCLRHPIRRFLTGVGKANPSIRAKLLGENPLPLRVLLVPSNLGDIPQADREVDSLKDMFCKWFEDLGWPQKENLTVLTSKQASQGRVRREITQGRYDILHLAGHGASEDDRPGIALYRRGGSKNDFAFVPDERLHGWIAQSQLSFVYLSCCHGAAPGVKHTRDMIRRFDNLAQAVFRAQVPEVVGFLWPVDDQEVKDFAVEFYRHFLEDFRPASALHAARQHFDDNQQIIASPVLYSLVDTESD